MSKWSGATQPLSVLLSMTAAQFSDVYRWQRHCSFPTGYTPAQQSYCSAPSAIAPSPSHLLTSDDGLFHIGASTRGVIARYEKQVMHTHLRCVGNTSRPKQKGIMVDRSCRPGFIQVIRFNDNSQESNSLISADAARVLGGQTHKTTGSTYKHDKANPRGNQLLRVQLSLKMRNCPEQARSSSSHDDLHSETTFAGFVGRVAPLRRLWPLPLGQSQVGLAHSVPFQYGQAFARLAPPGWPWFVANADRQGLSLRPQRSRRETRLSFEEQQTSF